MASKEVRILCTSDNHTGARTGLTHPDNIPKSMVPLLLPFWRWYEKEVDGIGPVDCHLHLGDAVDGQGCKDQGLGQLTTDTEEQAEWAAAVLGIVKAKCRKMVYGTPYHTVGSYSYEATVARLLGADIQDSQYVKAGGLRISARHVVGRSDTPYSQGTMTSKEALRDTLIALQDGVEAADIVLRGHIHTYLWIDNGDRYAGVVPALQLPGSIFGRTQRAWRYRVGILELRIKDGYCEARPHLMNLRDVRRRVYVPVG